MESALGAQKSGGGSENEAENVNLMAKSFVEGEGAGQGRHFLFSAAAV